jgi:hypothetical protein
MAADGTLPNFTRKAGVLAPASRHACNTEIRIRYAFSPRRTKAAAPRSPEPNITINPLGSGTGAGEGGTGPMTIRSIPTDPSGESGSRKDPKLPGAELWSEERTSGPGPPFQPVAASVPEEPLMEIGPAIAGVTTHTNITMDSKAIYIFVITTLSLQRWPPRTTH